MKLLIAGSRTLDHKRLFELFEINSLLRWFSLEWPTEFVHGGCPTGADKYAALVADSYWDTTKCKVFKADWNKWGNMAGPVRNREMAGYADALILIWDGSSKGSANMKMEMLRRKKPVYEIVFKEQK